ncbi:DoxX family protein [Roseateles asaccharophilus]|uniref:Membrane protein YphA (DoxX/SURF4 family) n=1 Tax=Roseateles asaccharophilus TaxID=582607 RepID=A0ABU2A995_9BURK|nr:DoxX family protein [Roseateles asaccharophilus]MDR7333057.1 putative membrane protein YphA (DoxX/SURF4 family) [Roseateles asaccharophilus]
MPAGRSEWLKRLALLALCGAYLQGGLVKLLDFDGAVAEMAHFGLQPAALFAVAVIVLELGASALVLSGRGRRWAALALAVFTVAASFMANAFWTVDGPDRGAQMNAFFEHLGLAGAWLLVALWDERSA